MKTALNLAVTWNGIARFLIKQSRAVTVDPNRKCNFLLQI